MNTHDTVVIDGSLNMIIDGGKADFVVINTSAEFGTFTAVHDYEYPLYTGPFDVVPSADEQVLKTAKKTVTNDITISQIPYTEISNLSGGYTVSIG